MSSVTSKPTLYDRLGGESTTFSRLTSYKGRRFTAGSPATRNFSVVTRQGLIAKAEAIYAKAIEAGPAEARILDFSTPSRPLVPFLEIRVPYPGRKGQNNKNLV